MTKIKIRCKSVILSDIHLGTPDAKAEQATRFLKHIRCEKLILNGDIIDGWYLKRKSAWEHSHTRFLRHVLKMIEKQGTEVIYLRGNHDDVLDRFVPIQFPGLTVKTEHIHPTARGDYLIIHGDGFDSVTTNYRWLAWMGAFGYDFLLRLNRAYNRWRAWRGKEYFSISKVIKAKVKGAVSFVGKYEEQLQEFARKRNCNGIICGHIHAPEDKRIGDVHYLNSGDWVESLTAIIEWESGQFQLLHYSDFQSMLEQEQERRRLKAAASGPRKEEELAAVV
ncbi:MAG: UDP-2,3-diacylglucosamine diphosphatase [Verrucomicrobiales bacterium]